jgi:hypothetical protein
MSEEMWSKNRMSTIDQSFWHVSPRELFLALVLFLYVGNFEKFHRYVAATSVGYRGVLRCALCIHSGDEWHHSRKSFSSENGVLDR